MSNEFKIGLIFFFIIGASILLPIAFPRGGENLKVLWKRMSSDRIRQASLPDQFDTLAGQVRQYAEIAERVLRRQVSTETKLTELADRFKSLESMGTDLFPGETFQNLQEQINEIRQSQVRMMQVPIETAVRLPGVSVSVPEHASGSAKPPAPESPPMNPESATSELGQPAGNQGEISGKEGWMSPEATEELRQRLLSFRRAYHNSKASDVDKILEFFNEYDNASVHA